MKKPSPKKEPVNPLATPKSPKRGLTKLDTPTHAHETAPLPVWRSAFLLAIGVTGNITAAATAASISRQRAYQVREADIDFAADWDAALEVAADALEREAWRRAVEGGRQYKFTKTGKPILHPVTGEPYFEHVYSDALLTLLLKATRPDKYKDRSAVETSQPPARPYDLTRLSPEQLAQLEALTAAATAPLLP